MDRADLIALASPPCHECGDPVQRVEMLWWSNYPQADIAREWWIEMTMICEWGHRVPVQPAGDYAPSD